MVGWRVNTKDGATVKSGPVSCLDNRQDLLGPLNEVERKHAPASLHDGGWVTKVFCSHSGGCLSIAGSHRAELHTCCSAS